MSDERRILRDEDAGGADSALTEWDREWARQKSLRRVVGARAYARCMVRGLGKRCPACGEGRVVRGFLRPNEECAHCGEGYDHIRTDDFAPWLSILVLGHFLLPVIISVERLWHPALWVHALLWIPLAAELIVAFLPRAKGMALGLMWALGLRGDEHQY